MNNVRAKIDSKSDFEKRLKLQAASHRSYKIYTSMERAMGYLLSGNLYLTDGSSWNDINDRNMMNVKHAYACSFSCSTRENIALWMLYGDQRGAKGAMLDFLPSVMNSFLSAASIELGFFGKYGEFNSIHVLSRSSEDYEILLTDIVYIDSCDKGMIKITVGDMHSTVNQSFIDHRDIFTKNQSWVYEKECRLVVQLSEKWKSVSVGEKLTCIRIGTPPKLLNRMRRDRLTRSPIYSNGADYGKISSLAGKVDWAL